MRGIEALIGDSNRAEMMRDNSKTAVSIEDLMVKMSDIMNVLTEMTLTKDEKYQEEINKEVIQEVIPEVEPETMEPILAAEESIEV